MRNTTKRFLERILILAILVLNSACVMLSQQKQSELTQATWTYRSAIRWNRFEEARSLHKESEKEINLNYLNDIKVSSYTPLYKMVSEDGNRVEQSVEIRYIRGSSVVERTLTHKQVWNYGDSGWFIEGNLPRFE